MQDHHTETIDSSRQTNEEGMKLSSFYMGGLLMLAVMVWGMSAAGDIGAWIYIPEMIIVGGLTVGGLWMTCGLGVVIRGIKAVLIGKRFSNNAEFVASVRVMDRGRNIAWIAGIFSFITGLIAILRDLRDPSTIGMGMATAMLGILYAVILAELIFAPCGRFLITRNEHLAGEKLKHEPWMAKMAILVIGMSFINMAASLMAFGEI
ncbi:flagellar motor protein MotP [Poriferisphaera corsica]|uniref:Flagellar motor protein MotP n=1 Tax=Poriferisphaera corsica TaxID=2528020 RepID=A0A517YRA0_9BACT|nr:hypothetical protein [Poriferisphaera corsica]QDU32755.1 flagellar motor protein MotP [Poriferisphaera corsica]